MSQPPQDPWGNSPKPQQPQQPQPFNFQQPVYPAQQQVQYPQVGHFGGVPEPKRDVPWWGVGLTFGFGFLVIFIIWYSLRPNTAIPVTASQPTFLPTWTVGQVGGVSSQSNFVTKQAITPITNPAVKPTPAIPVNPNPIVLTGKGTKPSDTIKLPAGLIKVNVSYDGPGFFSAMLFNVDSGSEFGWVTTGIDKYTGVVLGTANETGNYLFNVNATGTWKLEVYNSDQLQKEADSIGQTPYTVTGQGDTVFPLRVQKTGTYKIKITHKGSSYITVDSYKSDSFPGLIAAGGSGNYEGEQADKMSEGLYFFNVKCSDGTWTVTVTQ